MTVAFVLVWLSCGDVTSGGACYQRRLYFDMYAKCEEAQRTLPKDKDGLAPLISACLTKG